jgi:outer membrane receptor protein involved in Fe transport
MTTQVGNGRGWYGLLLGTALLSFSAASDAVLADSGSVGAAQIRHYHIGAQALGPALQELAGQAGLQLLFSKADVAGLHTRGLIGRYTSRQALERLLTGTGLVFEQPSESSVIIRCASAVETGYASIAHPPVTVLAAGVTAPADTTPSAEADSRTREDYEEVVVTGRAGQQLRTKAETSYSTTTIDSARLRLQGPTSVTESLKSVPGFWVEASGGEASGNVRARGVPVDGFGSITLLEDSMPVQHDPALGYLNGDQAFRIDETIDRIEVVRGGPSSVFYSNAPAGAVNYISRAVGDRADGIAKYTVGDYGLNRADFWYGAPIGDWKVSFGGFYRYDNGVRDPGFHGDDGGQLRLTLSRDLENGRISFDLKRLDDIVYLDLGIPMEVHDGSLIAVPGFSGNYGTVAGPDTALVNMKTANGTFRFDNTDGTQVKRTQATLKYEIEVAEHARITDSLRYDQTDTLRNGVFPNSLQSAASLLTQNAGLLAGLPAGSALQLRYADPPSAVYNTLNQNGNGLIINGGLRSVTSPVRELMNDLRLMDEFELGGTHDATAGFYVADVSNTFDRYSSAALLDVQDNARLLNLVAVDPAGNVLQTFTDHGISRYGYEWADANGQSTTSAFYLADEWQLTHALRLDAGVRWEKVRLTANVGVEAPVNLATPLGTPAASNILTGTGQYDHFEHSFNKVGWTVGGNYQISDSQGLFARYTPTFRLPSLSSYVTATLASPTATVSTPITQTMDLGEIGYKFANKWAEAYATAFWTRYNNVGFTNYVFSQNTVILSQQLFADTRTYGLELEGGIYPVNWFDLTFSATLEDPEYSNLTYTDNVGGRPVQRDFSGNQLIRVPKVSVRVVPGVNLFDQKLRLQASYEYEGARYVDTANSVILPHYDVVNVSARYSLTPHLELYGYVDNVTNSMGLTEGNPRQGEVVSSDAGANAFIARPILGRSYRLSLMYRL